MRMVCIIEPPGGITVRSGDFGRTLTKGDVVDFSLPIPGAATTWAEALAGHENLFKPEHTTTVTVTEGEEE